MCYLEMFSETNLKEVCQKLIHRSFSEFFLEKLYEEVFQKKEVIWKTFLVKSHPRQSSHKKVSKKLSENCADKF